MTASTPHRRTPKRAGGPQLRILLVAVLAAFVVLAVNAAYLGGVTLAEWWLGETLQGYAYQVMFLVHLALGLLVVVPVLAFMAVHLRNAWRRPNRRAVYAGLGLLVAVLLLLVSGLLLVRFDFFQVNDPAIRSTAYWLHVVVPFVVIWLFVLHRLAGPRIRWRSGLKLAGAGALIVVAMIVLQAQDPRQWNRPGQYGEADFRPALTRSATGQFIPPGTLMMDDYCAECHADAHAQWSQSAHRFASFNNPVYLFAVRNTRRHSMEIDGTMDAARFCAGCHDLVPLLSGAFDDPEFDDVHGPGAQAGITCTSCHAITHVNSVRGNGDFTIEEPVHYPFAFSESPALKWINAQLIKANPTFHKKTFLKPLHETPEFCSTCHKVHLPEQLNRYKWLRGQNHYDSFLLSGVSGHGVTSFYYPPRAEAGCNGCHMPLNASTDFGAADHDGSGLSTIHDHRFPGANTAIPYLLDLDPETIEVHREILEGSLRVDLVALREGGRIDGRLVGPLRPEVPVLRPGQEVLVEAVVRTLTLGHAFTQGTADSNQVWVEAEARLNGAVIGRSGGLDPVRRRVDPWSHFINVYMLDREGRRIDARDAENIFTPLYNHQIPPGAADVVHYRLAVPEDAEGTLEVTVRVHYRKFDTRIMEQVVDDPGWRNDLPITTLASDTVAFPVGTAAQATTTPPVEIPEWQRWNDYGIGALRKPERRQLRQAEELFARVEALGQGAGALNLARVHLEEGRLDEAADALARATASEAPPPPWSVAWFGGRVLFERGEFAAAIELFQALAETRFAEARERGFDFSRDYRLLNQLGLAWFELALARDGSPEALTEAARWFEAALVEDPENADAHYNLARIRERQGAAEAAEVHREAYATYRDDDNARDHVVAVARRADPAADHAADPVVIYDLHRRGSEAFALPVSEPSTEPGS